MPFDRSRYPAEWEAISQRIRFERAGGRCEWVENGERCEARHGEAHPVTGAKVVLTTAHHPNPDPQECRDGNLLALCQRCHNRLDAPMRRVHAAKTKRARQEAAGQMRMEQL